MRFRLVRSRVFWFGVPGLVFLLWGWWISMGYFSYAGFGGTGYWTIGQLGGEVFVLWRLGESPDWRDLDAVHGKARADEMRRLRYSLDGWRELVPTFRYVFIPYYWPVIGYVAGWAGLVFWRSRKYRSEIERE
jgi:hypothetical protein